jgi:hypothetical protein
MVQLTINFFLTKPLYVKIGDLDSIPVYTFFISLTNDEKEIFLIGLDVINQHSSIISRFNGTAKLVIINLICNITRTFFILYL